MAGYVNDAGEVAGQLFPAGQGAAFAEEMGLPYLGTVPFDPRLSLETDGGRPFILEHADSAAGRVIVKIAETLKERNA